LLGSDLPHMVDGRASRVHHQHRFGRWTMRVSLNGKPRPLGDATGGCGVVAG
jgi:hypothetical protein